MKLRSEFPDRRIRAAVGALVIASVVCGGMLAVRALIAGRAESLGFFTNLLLAWIPLVLAFAICWELDRTRPRRWLVAAIFALWLLFYPNAPYIVTDLVHLKTKPPLPRWFDYTFMMAHAITGLFLGYLSLAVLHERVRLHAGKLAGWSFVAAMLGAASLGVYVGRFFRWNSWDVLVRPGKPARDLGRFFHSDTLLQLFFFWSTFFSLLIVVYVVFHAFSQLRSPQESAEE